MTIHNQNIFARIEPLLEKIHSFTEKEEYKDAALYIIDQLILINDELRSVNELRKVIKELRIENLNQYRTIARQQKEITELKGETNG